MCLVCSALCGILLVQEPWLGQTLRATFSHNPTMAVTPGIPPAGNHCALSLQSGKAAAKNRPKAAKTRLPARLPTCVCARSVTLWRK